jgi:hypothetical protein
METPQPPPQNTNAQKKQAPLSTDVAAQIAIRMSEWEIAKDNLPDLLQVTQRSLETVTHLTEYEDDKANRILTAMAFLSAFAAVIFAVVPSRYPLSFPIMLLRTGSPREAYLLLATYGGFVLYALTLILGVAFVLYGMSPRFNVPKSWKPDGKMAENKKPASRLFFEKIVEVSPTAWANSFVNVDKDELLSTYVKNSVLETYLVAQKIVPKVKWLKRGVALFQVSTIILAFVMPMVVATLAFVPEPSEHQPLAVRQHVQQIVSQTGDGARSNVPPTGQKAPIDSTVPNNKTPPLKTK